MNRDKIKIFIYFKEKLAIEWCKEDSERSRDVNFKVYFYIIFKKYIPLKNSLLDRNQSFWKILNVLIFLREIR